MHERLSDALGSAPPATEPDDEAFEQVRARVQALISAARTLSDTCADLADALRPVPGQAADDPLMAGFGRLRAERTAALLDEAASAARGTLGLLHSAYGALDKRPRVQPPLPRSGASTWPDAFVESPPRAFTVDDEAGTAMERVAWSRTAPADATDPHGIPAVAGDATDTHGIPAVAGDASGPGGVPADATDPHGVPAVVPASADDAVTDTESALGAPVEPAPAEEPALAADATPVGPPAEEPALAADATPAGPPAEEPTVVAETTPDEPASEPAGADEADADGPVAAAEQDFDRPENFEGLLAWAIPASPARREPSQQPEPAAAEADVTAEPEEPEDADPRAAESEAAEHRAAQREVAEPAADAAVANAAEANAAHADAADAEQETSESAADLDPDSDLDPTAAPEMATTATAEPVTTASETGQPGTTASDAALEPRLDESRLHAVAPEPPHPATPAGTTPADTTPADTTPADTTPAGTTPDRTNPEHAAPEPVEPTPEPAIAANAPEDDPETLDGEGLRSWAVIPRPAPAPAEGRTEDQPEDEAWDPAGARVSIGAHTRAEDEADDPEPDEELDPHTPDDVDGEGLRAWAGPAPSAALAGWMVVDPDDADDPGHPIRERAVAAAQPRPAERLTVGIDDPDGAGWHGDTVSAEPRSLSLVPPVADGPLSSPWAAEPTWAPEPGDDLGGAAAFALDDHPVWAAEPVPAGDGPAVSPIAPREAPRATTAPEIPLEEPAAATIARQVEAARRHLQAALVVANSPAAPRLGALLTAVEQVLTAVTDLARETRGLLETGLADRTFPGEARFLCSAPWDGVSLVGRDAYGDDGATPAGLAKLLRALGYEAHSATSAGGMSGVQIRAERYSMQVALVEPAGGGRQRWSGALEWVDTTGANRTWAETLGPPELEDEELARRVDELLRRSIGSV